MGYYAIPGERNVIPYIVAFYFWMYVPVSERTGDTPKNTSLRGSLYTLASHQKLRRKARRAFLAAPATKAPFGKNKTNAEDIVESLGSKALLGENDAYETEIAHP